MKLLTIIQIVQINQTIGDIQSLTTTKDTLNQLWVYFNLTWMVRFPPSLWNISAAMVNRTNNALEHKFLYFEERYAEVRLNS
ncbi:hypothetical protein HZS_3421 [Henneguya salminicola]|nr:hypothetical protein HZS_3421 [Henneguya salminicola]